MIDRRKGMLRRIKCFEDAAKAKVLPAARPEREGGWTQLPGAMSAAADPYRFALIGPSRWVVLGSPA
jgi:hypothetical protein